MRDHHLIGARTAIRIVRDLQGIRSSGVNCGRQGRPAAQNVTTVGSRPQIAEIRTNTSGPLHHISGLSAGKLEAWTSIYRRLHKVSQHDHIIRIRTSIRIVRDQQGIGTRCIDRGSRAIGCRSKVASNRTPAQGKVGTARIAQAAHRTRRCRAIDQAIYTSQRHRSYNILWYSDCLAISTTIGRVDDVEGIHPW